MKKSEEMAKQQAIKDMQNDNIIPLIEGEELKGIMLLFED